MLAKRDVLVLRAVVSFAVGFAGWPAQAKYSGGSGTAEDPYRIASKKDLLALAPETKDYGAHVLLTADIDLSGQTFGMALIAPATETGPHLEFEATPFTGVFNGDGHKTTAQMQTAQTFLDASWDFDDVWNIVEGETYPFLRLGLVADLTCDGRVDLRDYARLAANWSKTCSYTKPKSPTVMCPLAGDLTGDREVNTQDLALMSAQWLEKR